MNIFSKTRTERKRALRRLNSLVNNDKYMSHLADAYWRNVTTNPDKADPVDPINCPFEYHFDEMHEFDDHGKGSLIAPFCSARGVEYFNGYTTEYDIECKGHAKECWKHYLAWSMNKTIKALQSNLARTKTEPDVSHSVRDRIKKAVNLIYANGHFEGEESREWLLDQILRSLLTESEYRRWLKAYNIKSGYTWNVGEAPVKPS